MAKFESHIFTSIRGSVGGLTYSRGKRGPIDGRAKRQPIAIYKFAVFQWRQAFSAAVADWSMITEELYQLWFNLVGWQDGGGRKLSARELFIGWQAYLYWAYWNELVPNPPDLNPPLQWFFPGFVTSDPAPLPAPDYGFTFDVTNAWNDAIYLIATISYPKNSRVYSQRGGFDPSKYQSKEIITGVTETIDFTGLIPGAIYFCKCRAVSKNSPYQVSTTQVFRAMATQVVP